MSYNINTFILKKLENLKIPVASLYKHDRKDWHPDRQNNDDGTVTFFMLESKMSGIIEGNIFLCQSIKLQGEGSGTSIALILKPALEDSTGELIASCVWEDGDTINRLIVKDGNVVWENIEI